MKKLAYVGGVAVASLLAATAVSYAKEDKAAATVEKKAAAATPTPAQPTPAKPDATKPAAGAPAGKMEPAKPGEVKPAEPPKMEAPKPAPEIAELLKQMQGAWKCSGTANGPNGQSMPMDFTITFKADIDKFWIRGDMAAKKTKASPFAFKFTSYTTFDAATKKWVRVMVDNTGGWEQASSAGLTNGQMLWEGKGAGMGMSFSTKHTEEIKGPKEVHLSGQMSPDGKQWMPMYDASCKK
jgi:hypothetical protein